MKNLFLILTGMSVILLSSCASTSQFFQDQSISRTANNNIYHEITINAPSNIGVTTQNGNVLITGQIPSQALKDQITSVVSDIDGVQKVYNFLEVGPPVSAATHATDSWITAKIKTEFVANKQISPSSIKIVTEDGTVFLMGEVTPEMGTAAAKIAKSTDNVREVVEIFRYIHVTDTP